MPTFLAGLLLIYFLCIRVQLLPVISRGTAKGLILPSCAMALSIAGEYIRQIRGETLEQMSQSFVLAERVRGDREWIVIVKNVLRNASLSLTTILGLSFAGLLGGSVVTETIFMWPGLGKMAMDAISNRDMPLLQGTILFTTVIVILGNLIADLLYSVLDPRIRKEG